MKTGLVIGAAILIGAVFVIQHNRIELITKEKVALQSELVSRSAAIAELEKRPKIETRASDDSGKEELMKLRNEVSRLHAMEAQIGKAKAEALLKESKQAQASKANMEQDAKAQFETKVANYTSASKTIALQLRIMQMRKTINTAFDSDGHLATGIISKSHPDFDVSKVEFLYPDPVQLAKITAEAPETIIARSEPLAAPDGTWSRIYTLADGSVHQKTTAQPNQVYEGKWQLVESKQ